MGLSEYFSDEDVICQLRSLVCDEDFDYEQSLSTVEEYDDDYFSVVVKDRRFLIHRIIGAVEELV